MSFCLVAELLAKPKGIATNHQTRWPILWRNQFSLWVFLSKEFADMHLFILSINAAYFISVQPSNEILVLIPNLTLNQLLFLDSYKTWHILLPNVPCLRHRCRYASHSLLAINLRIFIQRSASSLKSKYLEFVLVSVYIADVWT